MSIGSGSKTGCGYGGILFTWQTGYEVAPDKRGICDTGESRYW
jgi:hypothetical protein